MAGNILVFTLSVVILWLMFGKPKQIVITLFLWTLGSVGLFFAVLFTFHIIDLDGEKNHALISSLLTIGCAAAGRFIAEYYLSKSARNEDRTVTILGILFVGFLLGFGLAINYLRFSASFVVLLYVNLALMGLGFVTTMGVTIIKHQIERKITTAETKATT